jgi:hypothetical protein
MHVNYINNSNVSFQAQINRNEFRQINSLIISSLNKAFDGHMQLHGSSCVDIVYNLENARIPNDIDLKVEFLGSKHRIKKLLKQVLFRDLKDNGYIPYNLTVINRPIRNYLKKILKKENNKFLIAEFKLNPSDSLEYKHINKIRIEMMEEKVHADKEIIINGQNVKVLSPEVFVFDKIKALCKKTREFYLDKPDQNIFTRILNKLLTDPKYFPEKFQTLFSRGNFFYDLMIMDESLTHMNNGGNIDISLLKSVFKTQNVPLYLMTKIDSTYGNHVDNFFKKVKRHDNGDIKDFDYYFEYTMRLLDRLHKELNKISVN